MKLDERREEILATSGHIMIEGGPGCGKTTIALLKAARYHSTLSPDQRILFLSFSRAAVRQVTHRMKTTLSSAQRTAIEVRTFHAFFLNLVRSHGRLLTGEPARFITPEREAIIRADFKGDDVDWRTEKRRLATEESLYVFDTLAPTLADLLERSNDLRALYSRRYPIIVVDEFQDTNTDQWRVVRALSAMSTIVCLADPDQRIFDHLDGVDEHRLEVAKSILQPTTFDLSSDNHRSPASGILEYANAILRNTPTEAPTDVKFLWYRYESPEGLTHLATQKAIGLLSPHLENPPTIAILTRVNTFASRISENLTTQQEFNREALVPIDHILYWDPELAAASALVVASILEWPTLSAQDAVTSTLSCIADYYRVKLGLGTAGARSKINTIERSVKAVRAGKKVASKTAKVLLELAKTPPPLSGRSVVDWQTAKNGLKGSAELDELANKVRLIRMLNATDAVAWALSDTWNGTTGYVGAIDAVRIALAAESVNVQQNEQVPVHVMTMHKSKGKEYDAVVIVEDRHGRPLIDPKPGSKAQEADRRLLRVAVTRARHLVVLIRPNGSISLTPPLNS
ncbi:ATP-dependent helicase [Brevibacterium sp. CCUG 69071]|nr:ATP-dependent helicase [Brevibacterium sp. CCUG 69071]